MKEVSISNIIDEQISGEWGEDGDGVAVIRSTNFTNEGRLNLENVIQRAIDKKKIDKKKLLFGDSIIEKSGGSPDQPVGRVVYFDIQDGTFLCSNFTSILRPSKEVHPRYFFWFLFYNHQIKSTLKYQNKTTGIINLQLTRYLEETRIPLPSFQTQRRISDILNKADSLRQKDKGILKLYDELIQSVFCEMFGDPVKNDKNWPEFPLVELSTRFSDGPFGSNLKTEHYTKRPDGVRVIRLQNIGIDEFLDEDKSFINLDHYNRVLKKYSCFPGDVLIATMGDPNLRACTLPNNIKVAVNKADCVVFKPNSELIEPLFLTSLINNPGVLNLSSKFLHGQTRTRISMGQLSTIKLPIPPLALQKKYGSLKADIIRQKNNTLLSSISTESLFQSILSRAFKGGLE